MNPGKLIKNNNFLSKLQRFFSANQQSSFEQKEGIFESIFEHALNAYFIYSKETLEVIKINKMAVKLFELPPEKDFRGLYMTQVMMRYLAGDSPNLDFLMNTVSEKWTGEAIFNNNK